MRCSASIILSSSSRMSFFCTPSMYSVSSISCSVLEGVVRALSAINSYSLRSLCGCSLGVVSDSKGEGKDEQFQVMRASVSRARKRTDSVLRDWLSWHIRCRSWLHNSVALLASALFSSSTCSSNSPKWATCNTAWRTQLGY